MDKNISKAINLLKSNSGVFLSPSCEIIAYIDNQDMLHFQNNYNFTHIFYFNSIRYTTIESILVNFLPNYKDIIHKRSLLKPKELLNGMDDDYIPIRRMRPRKQKNEIKNKLIIKENAILEKKAWIDYHLRKLKAIRMIPIRKLP